MDYPLLETIIKEESECQLLELLPSVSDTLLTSPPPLLDEPSYLECCPVCGAHAKRNHFNVLCCDACAVFFRRTVTLRRSYICTTGSRCEILWSEPRRMCKYCRFKKCVYAGMNLNAVSPLKVNDDIGVDMDSPLGSAVLAQRENYFNRFAAIMKKTNENTQIICIGQSNPKFEHAINSGFAEFDVLKTYMKNTGFYNMGLKVEELNSLAVSMFYEWECYQVALATLRNGGQYSNTTFFPDDSHLKTNFDQMLKFFNTSNKVFDPQYVSEYAERCFSYGIDVAKQLHTNHMDEVEYSAIFQIYALTHAQRLFPRNSVINKNLQKLLSYLKKHYDNNYDDVAVKMGNVIFSITLIQNYTKLFTEYITILHLNGYDTIKSKVQETTTIKYKGALQ